MNDFNEKNYIILDSIAKSAQPLGAHKILNKLSTEGYKLSLSTVGRLLNELEETGYIQKEQKGRSITEKGRSYISKFQLINKSVIYHEHVNDFANNTEEKQINDFFDTRKIIEKEAVRLAVKNVSNEEMQMLIGVFNDEVNSVNASSSDLSYSEILQKQAHLDYEFHKLIIKFSKNFYLQNFYEILGFSERDQEIYAFIVGIRLQGHGNILQALKDRDEEAAIAAVEEHIEQVRTETLTYLKSKKMLASMKTDATISK